MWQGTGHIPFSPVCIEEQVLDRHRNPKIEQHYLQSISALPTFANKSFEELRMEDYSKDNRNGQHTGGFSFAVPTNRPYTFALGISPQSSTVNRAPVIHDGVRCVKCYMLPIVGKIPDAFVL